MVFGTRRTVAKIGLGLAGLLIVGSLVLFFWARAVLASDAVRAQLAQQISEALGHQVVVGRLSVSIFPRLRVSLRDVSIGQNAFITVKALDLATDFGALLSRRIEHATLRLDGARVVLPLPPLAIISNHNRGEEPLGPGARPAVEIASIDEIVLSGVDIVSGGRTLRGDIEVVPQGTGLDVRKISFSASGMTLTASGTITDLSGPVGALSVHADTVDFDRLLDLVIEFSRGVTESVNANAAAPPAFAKATTTEAVTAIPTPPTVPATDVPMNLNVTIEADHASMGRLAADHLTCRAVANDRMVSISPLAFGLFGGRYEGALQITLEDEPTFHWTASIANIDVSAATGFGGHGGLMTGMLNGRIDLTGRGNNTGAAIRSAHGTARLEVVNGVVRNLGLVRGVGNAASLSLEGLQRASEGVADVDERFTRVGGTMTIKNGIATSQDLRFEAGDVSMSASGTMNLDASALNLKGQLQLSDSLSRQVHQTLLKLSKDDGRVVLPATITGPAAAPVVKVDTGTITRRAIVNTATVPARQTGKGLKRVVGK